MIVLDEQLKDPRIAGAIKRWYKGQVINIKSTNKVIKDSQIATLLLRFRQPTFVTTNYTDFWNVMPAHRGYCVICFKLSIDRSWEVPDALREVLKMVQFNTKAKRMGKVISVTDSQITWYSK